MTNTEFTLQHRQQLFQASNKIVTQSTIPIFRFDENQLRLHGTGVFLRIGDRHFILTAAHVLDANVYHKMSTPSAFLRVQTSIDAHSSIEIKLP